MNILSVGDKSLVEKGFFLNSTADLLPALGFPGGLYNFCNFIIFSLMQVIMMRRSSYILQIQK